ncbi:cytochrome P450 [Streptomyces violaceusniger]|uniref:cytochrome P450 family protein n=1 Tax=Streptomyces violaceusniger TaxID=68280 RepID=UPI000996B82D|nr:cytochrome P450 [Streptomyces hygroscopicus]AQW56083.1 cytochrome P450 [Streptomyces hygroscopicus]
MRTPPPASAAHGRATTKCPYAGPALDAADPAFAADPYPFYAALRDNGPAAQVLLANGSKAWLVTGYDPVRTVLADGRFSNVPPRDAGRPKPDSPAQRVRALLVRHMLNTDAPDHTRLRRLVTATFTPRRVDALRPRIQELTAELLRDIPRGTEVDLVNAFAFPLPVLVISEVLGVPPTDRSALREWTYRVGSPADALPPGSLDEAWSSLHAFFSSLIEDKRRSPGSDLFSSLVHTELNSDELLAMAFLLLFAGYETTMNLLASAVLLLLGHPDELEEPHWPHVVEETLRHASPLEAATWRRTVEDVWLGGQHVPAGASVLGVLAAASRDPSRYPEPDVFRPQRWAGLGAPPSLAFGHGPHYCIGARLARLEALISLPALFEALPGMRLAMDPAQLPYRPGLLVRGPRTLPVRTHQSSRTPPTQGHAHA